MIDMHIHSTYSDGTKNVVEILQLAQELGLKAISFTDHECCDAYGEWEKIDIDKYYDGKILGSTNAKPDTTTEVEKNYEVVTYKDSNNYEYTVLEFMK